jgi:isoleucyl-tRNA synthetase
MTRQLQAQCEADYERFEFHRVVQSLQTFCSEDLGGFYLDILKDRLYTTAAASPARRSAQSALWHILQCLTKLMAPILCFTAEEIWQLQSGDREQSVMLHTWQPLPAPAAKANCSTNGARSGLSRRSHARPRRTAHRRQDRLVAAGRGTPALRRREARDARFARRRPALCPDLLADDGRVATPATNYLCTR